MTQHHLYPERTIRRRKTLTTPARLERVPTRLRFPGALTIDDESGALIDLVGGRDVAQALDYIDVGAWF